MKTYIVEGFGEVGEANLHHGVIESQGKPWGEIAVGESTNVKIQGDRQITRRSRHSSDKRKSTETPFTRITRTR
jgi:hypothetical protein